jgi:alkylation response protein AidB-like acyl-CoA dehydrogenase
VVRHHLAGLAVEVAEVEALTLDMLQAVQEGRPAVVEAAANKLWGSEVCQRIARLATEFGAPEALVRDCELEFLWRQTMSETIGGGTSEIMRGLIARNALGLAAKS